MIEIGKELHDLRIEASIVLEEKIKSELSYVGLEKARISIKVEHSEDLNSRGYDEVNFLFQQILVSLSSL
jgi:DNA repair protein RecN (Recombination protein N)